VRLHAAWALASICAAVPASADPGVSNSAALVEDLLRDPTSAEWGALSRFNGTLTRAAFEAGLDGVFDPERGLRPYLRVSDAGVAIYGSTDRRGPPLAEIRFASQDSLRGPLPVPFRTPRVFQAVPRAAGHPPLQGLRIVIEPADIGGRWARMEDRSVYFRGYGLINEGDLNLVVARLLRARLAGMGAQVFLVRDRSEPVVPLRPGDVLVEAERLLARKPSFFGEAFRHRIKSAVSDYDKRQVAAEILVTKALETRARVALVRRSFQADLTIVLQHNATAESTDGRLTPTNRNIFFVNGAYLASELQEPEQRFRLLTKLFENVTPTETRVAAAISGRFLSVTGYGPVLYGNSATTRLVAPGNPYVVARNLAFNREHDGPVVVTEPYFMNQPDTLQRLLAGDFPGRRVVAGRLRDSIYREYADCVASGVLEAYGAH
jgi:hypothetical protein